MPWTEADKEAVLEAMRQIIAGERVIVLTTADRSETRQVASLEELRDILGEIDASVTPRPRIFRTSYEAASVGRRLSVWTPSRIGPNDGILRNLDLLRARSRDSVRNNAWIKKGINSWVSNEIGTGIVPRAVSPDPEFN